MAAPQHDPHDASKMNGRLVAAVMAKDSHAVWECLGKADPNTSGPDGLPLLCTAVDGFDHKSTEALVDCGADPDVVLPDGTTPLLRAVDLGSPVMVEVTLGKDPRLRIPEAERKRLLGLARDWYETGEDEELRRRTGASGPATRRLVTDDEFTDIEEVSLGGLTVRAGHSGVLTVLERAFWILPPVAELVARAVPCRSKLHANWAAVRYALAFRKGPQAWSDLAALRHHPDPVHRRLLADVLWSRSLDDRPDTAQDAEFLAQWALDEPDGEVLADVLDAYKEHDHPAQEAIGLRHADHPDPRVRREVSYCLMQTPRSDAATAALLTLAQDPDSEVRCAAAQSLAHPSDLTPAVREGLLTLLRDPDPGVRRHAAASLSGSHDQTTAVMEALVALLDEEDQILRLEAAYALAVRDDPRTDWAYERVGPLGPGFEHDHRVYAHRSYTFRNRPDGT
ncbi:HEAT repeat domain-containing protein [Streptomyces thermoalcalitolerans]|uniref:Lyase n=1 Tax=Streptomyces thermoalcalitolerans TaxID=65605 RepID=A0ABN1NJ10_9ACTN